ncbi:MAG: dephospho-CoA kinase [Alistipes senegalensis]|nr:dephospho-CoA kinase [Oxalobacter formigenes]MCM1280459.1 dephospho-CoA kinase [Alistipes senegalensis]
MSGSVPFRPAFSLGLTGGIGSGKSTVARLFAERGASVIDTDDIAHSLTAPGGLAMPAICSRFGPEFVSESGALNRAAMRELVFREPAARGELEGILHPMIRQAAFDRAARFAGSYVIFVIPLLTEQAIWQDMPDRILLVDCPEALQISRVMVRSKMSEAQVKAVMAAQATRAERRAMADDVIVNDGAPEALAAAVAQLDAKYRELARQARLAGEGH